MIEDTVKEFLDILDQQEEKKYPDEDGNEVYWFPTKFEATNPAMDAVLDKFRNGSIDKQTVKDFFRIMNENVEIKIGSCRVLDVDRLKTLLIEMEKYSKD